MTTIETKNTTQISLILCVLLSVFFGYELGNRPFANPDEGRYVEIPREMVMSGDYVTPRLNTLKYFEKPPLFYWMQAASIKIFGINETSMRIWLVIFAVLGCLSVFFASILYGNSVIAALTSTGVLATTLLYYIHSRLIILDLVLSVFISASLWCFFLAFVSDRKRKANEKKALVISMYALAALAGITKGLIGIALPGMVAFLWIAFTKNWKKIKEILYLPGIITFLTIFLPWHIIVCLRNPDFFNFYFIHEHFLRYTTTVHQRFEPMWFFIPITLLGLFPWTGFAIAALKNAINSIKKSENIFLLSWVFGILAFFSLSNSKLIPYILPIFPPIAYMIGTMLVNIEGERDFKVGSYLSVVITVILIAVFVVIRNEDKIAVVVQHPDIITIISVFGIMMAASAVTLLCGIFFKLDRVLIIALYTLLSANMLWIINKAIPYYQDIKKPSTKEIAETIRINMKDGDAVFCYGKYYQDFPVHLNSQVGVVDDVDELEFGMNSEKDRKVIFSSDEFWDLWKTSSQRIFLLLSREKYRELFTGKNFNHVMIDFDKHFIAISNF